MVKYYTLPNLQTMVGIYVELGETAAELQLPCNRGLVVNKVTVDVGVKTDVESGRSTATPTRR